MQLGPGQDLPYDPQAMVARGEELARAMYRDVSTGAKDRPLDGVRTRVHGGGNSWFNRITNVAMIGIGGREARSEHGDVRTSATTIHELTHHWMDAQVGVGGLLYAGGPGRLSEGLSQVMSGAAMVLGGNEREQAWGWDELDPRGDTAAMPSMFGKVRQVPLSTTMDDVRKAPFTIEDNGYVHVHSGVIQMAHYWMAQSIGMRDMARITVDAAERDLRQLTGFEPWARATIRSAERLFGAGSAQRAAVADAWRAVKLELD